jgi:hypothetical protein
MFQYQAAYVGGDKPGDDTHSLIWMRSLVGAP